MSVNEYFLVSLLNSIPYILLVVYALRDSFRYSTKITYALVFLLIGIQIGLFFLGAYIYDGKYAEPLSVLCTIFYLIFLMIASKTYLGRKIFYLVMVCNIANFIMIAGKLLESYLFPANAHDPYHYTFSLCLMIVEVLVLTPFFFYLRWFCNDSDNSELAKKIWKLCWLVPVTFYILWFYVFYKTTDLGSLEMALRPQNTVYGAIIIAGELVMYALISIQVKDYANLTRLQEEHYQLSMKALQYQTIEDQILATRTMRHDLHHHMNLMCQYADNGEYEKLTEYLHHYSYDVSRLSNLNFTGNTCLNMLTVYFSDLCKLKDIDYQVSLVLPEELPLDEKDISVLFGNLLENAMEACEHQKSGSKFIEFKGLKKQNQYIFSISNSYDNEILQDEKGNFTTTKSAGHGIGTKSIQSIIKEKGGVVHFQTDNHIFKVSFIIPEQPISSRNTEDKKKGLL